MEEVGCPDQKKIYFQQFGWKYKLILYVWVYPSPDPFSFSLVNISDFTRLSGNTFKHLSPLFCNTLGTNTVQWGYFVFCRLYPPPPPAMDEIPPSYHGSVGLHVIFLL